MDKTTNIGVVTSLHLHSVESNKPMQSVSKMTLVEKKGILNNPRYYDTKNKMTDKPNKNHISLIEIEQIAEHADKLNIKEISPGLVRSNIETSGINLINLVGCNILIGDTSIINFYKARIPCKQMDDVYKGLFKIMKNKQGVIAEIIKSGEIKIGDKIQVFEEDKEETEDEESSFYFIDN